jgi:hypothetical protein
MSIRVLSGGTSLGKNSRSHLSPPEGIVNVDGTSASFPYASRYLPERKGVMLHGRPGVQPFLLLDRLAEESKGDVLFL